MRTTKDEINMTKRELDLVREKLRTFDRKNPEYRFKWAIINSEKEAIERKLEDLYNRLQEEYKNGTYIPCVGDERYDIFPNKRAIDTLRIKHYDLFGNDPSITYCDNSPMFDDSSLLVSANVYKIKESIPFKLKIYGGGKDTESCPEASILATFSKNHFKLAEIDKYVGLVASFIKEYTDKQINFIYTDVLLDEVHFAKIDDSLYSFNGQKRYYQFFYNLFNNLGRNIVYIGDSMKDGVPLEEVNGVCQDFINPSREIIARNQDMTLEELEEINEEVRKKVLTNNHN